MIPPHDVIEDAAAVVTLNNTGGYEALLHGKPVVTLGDAFYSGHGYTFDVERIDDLERSLDRAVRSGGLEAEEIVEFAHGLLEGSYQGEWADARDENVDNLTESIVSYLDDC